MSTASRTPKWRLPPSPKILHFPRIRRTRRRKSCAARTHGINPFLLLHHHHHHLSSAGNLNKLCQLDDEKELESSVDFSSRKSMNISIECRNPVEEQGGEDGGKCGGGARGCGEEAIRLDEEKWMFQAEILRAECNFLRMEREFPLKKLERNRVKMERTLRSAIQTLISGRKKLFEGKNLSSVLEKEIGDLSEKLEELHRSSRVRNKIVRNCSNFDKKAFLLQCRLGKLVDLPEERCLNGLQELNVPNLHLNTNHGGDQKKTANEYTQVDELSKKMEGLSNGMVLGISVEEGECGSMLGSTGNSIVDSSVSDSKEVSCPNLSSFSTRQDSTLPEDNRCSGHCRAIVRRIVEQVRAETEQWSQMQEMLERVRGEMEELQASHDFWEKRAHASAHEIHSLKQSVEEWKEKALGYETKFDKLEQEVYKLEEDLQRAKAESKLRDVELKENHENKHKMTAISLGKQLAKERKMLLLQIKERPPNNDENNENPWDGRRRKAYSNRSGSVPLRDIGNSLR